MSKYLLPLPHFSSISISNAPIRRIADSLFGNILIDRTNDIHMEIVNLAARIIALCEEGININLDPPCVEAFKRARNEAWVIKQRSKAEMEGSYEKGKMVSL